MSDEPDSVGRPLPDSGLTEPAAPDEEPVPHAVRTLMLVTSALFAVLLLALTVAAVGTYAQNTARFNKWKAQLEEHPIPGGTALVDSGSRFGVLWGQGSHCDGEMWVILSGDVSRDELEEHYADFTNVVVKRASGRWRVSVLRTHIGPAGLDLRCH